jgi:hypothetical protein
MTKIHISLNYQNSSLVKKKINQIISMQIKSFYPKI